MEICIRKIQHMGDHWRPQYLLKWADTGTNIKQTNEIPKKFVCLFVLSVLVVFSVVVFAVFVFPAIVVIILIIIIQGMAQGDM